MYSYVMLGASDMEQSRQFYDAFFGALGLPPGIANGDRYFYVGHSGTFGICPASGSQLASHDSVGTVGFGALSPQDVDAACSAGQAAGGTRTDDPVGWLDSGVDGPLYMAYLRDPSGNKLCVLHQPPEAGAESTPEKGQTTP